MQQNRLGGNLRGVMAKVLDCEIVVSEFELQSVYYVHFWTNSFGKDMNLSILACNGLNNTTTILLQGWFWYQITPED